MRPAVLLAAAAVLAAGCTQAPPPPAQDEGDRVVLLSVTVRFANQDNDTQNEVLLLLKGTGDDGRPRAFDGDVVLDLWNGTGPTRRPLSEDNRRGLAAADFDPVDRTYELIVNGLPFQGGATYSYRLNVTLAATGRSLDTEGTFAYVERGP